MATPEQDDIDRATAALAKIPNVKVSIVSYIADRNAQLEAVVAELNLSASDRAALNAAVVVAEDDMNAIANAIIAGTPVPPQPAPVEPLPIG